MYLEVIIKIAYSDLYEVKFVYFAWLDIFDMTLYFS